MKPRSLPHAWLVIDQGTSSTKGFVFSRDLEELHAARVRHSVHRPRPGWVECDAEEISVACRDVLRDTVHWCHREGLHPAAVGLAVQRSTFLFWDRLTGRPLAPAMSWQDSRAQEVLPTLRSQGHRIHARTGTPLSAHFGGPKFLFTTRHDPTLENGVRDGSVTFGPLSAFVTRALTGRAAVDHSIAGRTLLMDLRRRAWDSRLLQIFGVPRACLPPLATTRGPFGSITLDRQLIPLQCVIGDQQAALVGQGAARKGMAVLNLGTSGSVLADTGLRPRIVPGLLSNILYSERGSTRHVLEGTINSVSALFRWLETRLDIPHAEMRWEDRCQRKTPGILVPGLNGISSPYWTGQFETLLDRLSFDTDRNDVVRAAMESVGFLVHDILERMSLHGVVVEELVASGGAARPVLLQFVADITGRTITVAEGRDMTARGVALLLSGRVGNSRKTLLPAAETFLPLKSDGWRARKVRQWQRALTKVTSRLATQATPERPSI